jgi:hypothetical protein
MKIDETVSPERITVLLADSTTAGVSTAGWFFATTWV